MDKGMESLILQKLMRGDYNDSSNALAKLEEGQVSTPEMILLRAWIRLKTSSAEEASWALMEVAAQIDGLPESARKSALYFYVRGLAQNVGKNPSEAKKSLLACLKTDPGFAAAKSDLAKINQTLMIKPKLSTVEKLKKMIGL